MKPWVLMPCGSCPIISRQTLSEGELLRKAVCGRRLPENDHLIYLFIGLDNGGKSAAIAYTLIETVLCRARHSSLFGINRQAQRRRSEGMVD